MSEPDSDTADSFLLAEENIAGPNLGLALPTGLTVEESVALDNLENLVHNNTRESEQEEADDTETDTNAEEETDNPRNNLAQIMADKAYQSLRPTTPRQLVKGETLSSLRLWRTTFETYIRRDPFYYYFIRSATKWNPLADNYGFQKEVGGLEREPDVLSDDLKIFQNIFGGFLPAGHLIEKFRKPFAFATICRKCTHSSPYKITLQGV